MVNGNNIVRNIFIGAAIIVVASTLISAAVFWGAAQAQEEVIKHHTEKIKTVEVYIGQHQQTHATLKDRLGEISKDTAVQAEAIENIEADIGEIKIAVKEIAKQSH